MAGGNSTRFGADKALAEIDGSALLDLALAALDRCCDAVVIVGRSHTERPTLTDWPRPGLGPLGAIAAALHHARKEGFTAVLTCGVDAPGLPADLPILLAPAPAFVLTQPVIGLWPISALETLETILHGSGSRAMRAFAEAIGARPVDLPAPLANINTADDLSDFAARRR